MSGKINSIDTPELFDETAGYDDDTGVKFADGLVRWQARSNYTVDKASNWTAKGFPGSGAGVVYDIAFSNMSVGYLAHATATPAGRILRTYDGGYSWQILPEGSGTIAANDRINRLAPCIYDENLIVGVGLDDNATDGVIVVGRD